MRHVGICARVAVVLAAVDGANDISLGRPDRVVGDDEVELAVVIVIEPCGSHAENVFRLAANAGALRYVRERAVAVVVIKHVAPGVADKQVGEAVVVVVAGGHAETEPDVLAEQPGARRDVLESAVAAVAEQAIVEARIRLFELRQLGAVGEVEVHAAVVIKIERRDTAAHGLGEVFSAGEIVVAAISEIGLRRDVGEMRPRGFRIDARRGDRHQPGGGGEDRNDERGSQTDTRCDHRGAFSRDTAPRCAACRSSVSFCAMARSRSPSAVRFKR